MTQDQHRNRDADAPQHQDGGKRQQVELMQADGPAHHRGAIKDGAAGCRILAVADIGEPPHISI